MTGTFSAPPQFAVNPQSTTQPSPQTPRAVTPRNTSDFIAHIYTAAVAGGVAPLAPPPSLITPPMMPNRLPSTTHLPRVNLPSSVANTTPPPETKQEDHPHPIQEHEDGHSPPPLPPRDDPPTPRRPSIVGGVSGVPPDRRPSFQNSKEDSQGQYENIAPVRLSKIPWVMKIYNYVNNV